MVEKCQKGSPEIIQSLGKSGDPERIDLTLARKQDPRGLYQVVATVGAARPKRDSTHGIGDVLVEPREEAETVLSGKVLASAHTPAGYRQAASLAAEGGVALVNRHRKTPFRQLVRRAQSAHAAAEDRYRMFSWHGDVLSLPERSMISHDRDEGISRGRHSRVPRRDSSRAKFGGRSRLDGILHSYKRLAVSMGAGH